MKKLCINDTFSKEWELYFQKHGIVKPMKGNIYTIRETIKYPKGDQGYLLNEIRNKPTPRVSSFSNSVPGDPAQGGSEQSWSVKRFADCDEECMQHLQLLEELRIGI